MQERVTMSLWKRLKVRFFVIFYTVVYFGRWDIHHGRIGNRIEIQRKARGETHKVFISYPLRTIKL